MIILITGCDGFIAKNLSIALKKNPQIKLLQVGKKKNKKKLFNFLSKADAVFHLAGVNRSSSKKEFFKNNYNLTQKICNYIEQNKLKLKFFFPSTIHINERNFYGLSKKKAEESVLKLKKNTKCSVFVYRLPNIFGKGCLPFYNSVIATFCYQLTRNETVTISNQKKIINFLYIDDLINQFEKNLYQKKNYVGKFVKISKISKVSLGKLLGMLKSFSVNTNFGEIGKQKGFTKNLFSVYLSYLPHNKIVNYKSAFIDSRGSFYELLKSKDMGQISFLTILPKKTRGNHFHNTKVELFFLVSGLVKFNIQNIFNKKKKSFILKAEDGIPSIVTQPGYAHNIVNIGKSEAKFVIWSNEIYNPKKPDTQIYNITN